MRLTVMHIAEIVGIYNHYFSANYNLDNENDLNLVADAIHSMINKAFGIDIIKAILKGTKQEERA